MIKKTSLVHSEDVIDILKVMGRELTETEIEQVVREHATVYAKSKEGTWDEIVLEQADEIIKNRK